MEIEAPLAEEVLRGTFRPGDVIRAEIDGADKVVFDHALPINEGLPHLGEPAALA